LNKQFDSKQGLNDIELTQLYEEIERELAKHDWIAGYKHLPLVAVGGTARAVGKIHQASIDYPLAQTHNYPMSDADVMELFNQLRALPQDKRKKTNGLSKDRADVIIPGLAILTKIFQYTDAERYVICGAGLRDGVFHKLFFPEQPLHNNPLEYSIENLIALRAALLRAHTDHLRPRADQLLCSFMKVAVGEQGYALYSIAGARAYRVVATSDYCQCAQHTLYVSVHPRVEGL